MTGFPFAALRRSSFGLSLGLLPRIDQYSTTRDSFGGFWMPRQGLNRRKVLEAALQLVDDGGLQDLTMRRLANRLGVEAPSLYKHVDGKSDILDGIADLVYEEIELVHVAGEFRDRALAYSLSFRRALLRHPNAAPLVAMRPVTGESTIQLVETALQELGHLGFAPTDARKFLNVTVGFIVGHALAEVGTSQVGAEEILASRREFEDAEYPNVAVTLAAEPVDYDAEFLLGIELIVDGIERYVSAPV